MPTGNFVFLIHSLAFFGDGDRGSRDRGCETKPLRRHAARRDKAQQCRIGRHAAGRCAVRVDLAPGKRTVAIRGETAIVLFD
ncbi:hypothetical protein EMIT0158MI4_110234 [Burkholderia ambifaria]